MALAIECGASSSVAIYVTDRLASVNARNIVANGGNEAKNENGCPRMTDNKCTCKRVERFHFGPANFKLLRPLELEKYFRVIARTIAADLKSKSKKGEQPNRTITALAVAMPGVLNDNDKKTLRIVLSNIWPNLRRPIWVGNDLESAMSRLRIAGDDYAIRVVAISGTGSCCYGTDGLRTRKIGGYGHVIGDRGSGYAIAYRGLRLALLEYEHKHENSEAYSSSEMSAANDEHNGNDDGASPRHYEELEKSASSIALLKLLLAHLNMIAIYELVSWSLVASKHEIADLARVIIRAAQCGNSVAAAVIDEATTEMADDIVCLIRKLKSGRPKTGSDQRRICVGLTGSVFTQNMSFFGEAVKQKIDRNLSPKWRADIRPLKDTVIGALHMILDDQCDIFYDEKYDEKKYRICSHCEKAEVEEEEEEVVAEEAEEEEDDEDDEDEDDQKPSSIETDPAQLLREKILPLATGLAETERRNIRSMTLSSMPLADAVELMIDEESRANRSLREHVSSFVTLVERITGAFRTGGRLFYVGAGSSGRIGILDASECPPTFKAPPHWVQGIIAGGSKAIHSSIEGAEDSIEDGIMSIREKDICDKDVVLGIAACGRTPFVWGGLYEANCRGAYTALLTFNRYLEPRIPLNQLITVNSGPEVLTGSTRLKAGTITKCVLNMLTTLSMVRYGKCLENLMVDLMPVNEKLRDRALRITMLIVDDHTFSERDVEAALIKNQYNIKATVAELRRLQ